MSNEIPLKGSGGAVGGPTIEALLQPGVKDIGDFEVRRLLPADRKRSVGPFVFWDHFGPVTLPADANMDVRPHPHIGLATVTWLFAGEIRHRDSLGNVQDIRPGAVNWMTAGRGIVHSERTPPELRHESKDLHGLQIWLGLPAEHENAEPEFHHYPSDDLPAVERDGVVFELVAGRALGAESPVKTYSPLCYLTAELAPGQQVLWPRQYPEQAVYVVEGAVEIHDQPVSTCRMAVLADEADVLIRSPGGARIAVLGGEPIGRRYVWWNFVASAPDRIRQAAERWENEGFGKVPDDDEFIPLPKDLPFPDD